MTGIPITLTVTCPDVPFQVEGTISGFPFYFRERHARWSFDVALDHGSGYWTTRLGKSAIA